MTVEKLAALFVEARRNRLPFVIPADAALESVDEAYRVQDAVYAQLWPQARPPAWKVGSASDSVGPTGAPIALLRASPARFASAGMTMIGIEAEIALRFDRDVDERDPLASVPEALVAIEVCDTRLSGWKEAPPLWKLADFQSSEALVVGSGTRMWRHLDFARQGVELAIGARTISARGSHSWGNPLRLLPWAAAHCARRGRPLRAGDVLTTGSWTGMEFARPGDDVVARFPGIGEATVRFDA